MHNESMRTATKVLLDGRGTNKRGYRLGREPENSGRPIAGSNLYWRTTKVTRRLPRISDFTFRPIRRPG
jgi:hypothetical protein